MLYSSGDIKFFINYNFLYIMAQELNAFEKEEILKIAKSGICRQNDVLRYNSVSGRMETAATFNLDNFPKFDAVLVIGGYPRAIYHASMVLKAYRKKYGMYPEFMTVGKHSLKGPVLPLSEAEMTERAMIGIGFNKDYVMRNHLEPTGCEINGIVDDIRAIVRRSFVMSQKTQLRIAVISECGLMLNLAQMLSFRISDYEFWYYETPLTPESERVFLYERFDGYWVDIIIATAFNSQRRWDSERLSPSDSKMQEMPSFDTIRRYIDKGYAFYMTPAMLRDLGYREEQIKGILDARRLEVVGDGSPEHPGMPDAAVDAMSKQFETFVFNLREQM